MDGKNRAERIAAARAALAAAKAARPDDVLRYEARMARLADAARRERERFETLVIGRRPEPAPLPKKPAGMSRSEWKAEKARLRTAAAAPVTLAEKWSHKQGTPETLERAACTHQGAIAQLLANGTLDAEQVEWVAEIANVHRSIEADVAVAVASLEARVDQSGRGSLAVAEGIRRVRLHHAYTLWRNGLPLPRQMVLDMIVGDAIGYTVAAKRYGVHNRKAKRMLIDAINRWPNCVDAAHRQIDADRYRELVAVAE